MTGGADIRSLREVEIFRDVKSAELEPLVARSHRRSYLRGQFISGAERDKDDVLVVVQGRARLYRVSREGRELTLATLQAGDVYGAVFVSPAIRPRSSVRAAVDHTVVYHISRQTFRRFIVSHPEVAIGVIAALSRRLVDAYDRIEDLSFSYLGVRLAHELARLARSEPDHVVSITRDELAALTGASREEVTKSLHDLRERGLVEYRPYSRTITVLDPEQLAAM